MKRFRRILPYAAGAVALVVVVVLLIALTGSPGGTAEVILPPPVDNGDGLNGDSEDGRLTAAEVSVDTVRAVLSTLARADSYSRVLTVETFWAGGAGEETISVWAKGADMRVVSGEKNLLMLGDVFYLWYDDGGEALVGDAAALEADRYQRILTYEALLDESADILDAGYTQLDGEPCIYAECRSGAFDYVDRLYISVRSGLLVAAETLDGDTVVYRMSSGAVNISTPADDVFVPPSGVVNRSLSQSAA